LSGAIGALIGLIAGAVLLGLGLYLYFILTTVKSLTEQLKGLISTLTPIFSSGDVLRAFQSFNLLAAQGEQLGRRLEALDKTIQQFYQFTFRNPNPTIPAASSESFTAGYDEEDAAVREVARKLRKEGVEVEEGHVSQAKSELPPQNDNPVF
jgi:hypothetical protein